MAYKPYKINRGNMYPDVKKKDPKYEIPRMKTFGLRTGHAWKMIPALLYYIVAGLFVFFSISGELREFTFEQNDYILFVLKYAFIIMMAYSPIIFLSDYNYVYKLPLFKKKTIGASFAGLIIVFVFGVVMMWTYQYCMSDTYKASANAYYERMEELQNQAIEEYESQSKAELDKD